MRRPRFLIVLAFTFFGCSSSKDNNVDTTDAGDDTIVDAGEFEEPVFDSDDPLGRVLILPLYDPVKRCMMPATEIGHFDQNPDGTIKDCGMTEMCYERPDGILAYHNQDCVRGSNFRANWKASPYSDLGPCEVIKRLSLTSIKECPYTSCTFARDITIDTTASCATAIESKGCRDVFGPPTSCFCNGTSAFVAANPKATTTPPSGYTACDSSNEACKKALAIVDTVKGCAMMTPMDAGTDAPTDGG